MAQRFIGRQVQLFAGRESTRGTLIAAQYKFPQALFDVDLKVIKTPPSLAHGGIWDGNQSLVALKWAEGKFQTDFLSRSMGLILYSLFGTLSSSGVSDSAYTHTLTLQNDVLHDSLSLYATDVNKTESFALSMIKSLEIIVVPDDVVKVNVEFLCKSPGDATAPATVFVADNLFLGRHATIKIAALTGNLAAASKLTGIKEFKIKFDKNAIAQFVLSTIQPEDINNRKFEITGSIKADFMDDTYRDLVENATYRALRFNLNNVDALIGATSTNQFTLDLSRVHFEGWEKNPTLDDVVEQVVAFRALYDLTNGNVINSCTLVNAVASYT